jgi:hypothetical protein
MYDGDRRKPTSHDTQENNMKKPMYRLLCAIAVAAAASGQAQAAEVQSPYVAMDYNEYFLTPVSHDGNSFTFAFTDATFYEPTDSVPYIIRNFYDFSAQPHYALTGKMSVQVNANYKIEDTPGARADINTSFDVLIPHCDLCNPYDSTLLSKIWDYRVIDTGSTLHVEAGPTPASGAYDRLWLYLVLNPQLSNFSGQLQLTTITFNAETFQTSPVPELPPVALLTGGLALLGMLTRRNRSKKTAERQQHRPIIDL